LVSNLGGVAPFQDPNAVNTWGIVYNANQLFVADNGTGFITTYSTSGSPIATPITVPSATSGTGSPDGLIYYGGTQFIITSGSNSGPARLLTSTEDGTVSGYNSTVNPTTAIVTVNRSGVGAVYKGLVIVGSYLYVCDFHNNRIDTFDSSFNLLLGFPFVDPTLPSGFAPFNIVSFNNLLYILYAKQDPIAQHDDVAGPGNGYVSVFSTNGTFVNRLISGGYLNSPWAMIQVPILLTTNCTQPAFLIGNFGNGTIAAYSSQGVFLGKLRDYQCVDLIIDGLWGLAQGTGNVIFFASGPNRESNGLVGSITPITPNC